MADDLHVYRQKRQFAKTAEPRGKSARQPSGALHFVVQHHAASRDHFDFRLEWDGVLKSWAVPKGPSYNSGDKRLAVQVEDHPLEYRGFEGTIPKGQYGGGTVMVWDEGTWQPLGDAGAGLAEGSLKFTLGGSRLKGRWALVRMKPKPGEKDNNWLLIKEKDEFEHVFDVSRFTTSITTGRTMEEIAAGADEKEEEMEAEVEKETKAAPEKAKRGQRGEKSETNGKALVLESTEITHPEKALFTGPDITKGDVARYYAKVAGRMLPYLENRVLSVVRCPGGIESACFFKKHPTGQNIGIGTLCVPAAGGGEEGEYYYVENARGLLFEVQMNTLEFHPRGSRVKTLEQPDVMVFDLDPDEGLGLPEVRQGVRDLKDMLDQLPLKSYLKTSGGKGYHVVIPFKPSPSWDAFHQFAKNIAKTMEAMWPDRYTANERKTQRKGKIFIDWMRNGRGATSVAPYSVRARPGAPVSMPLAWNELDAVAPNGISMEEALARLRRKDPWADFFGTEQQMTGQK